ncbi:MAG: helix-turn-helix domain-containing protein [Sciscionella sp.]
MRSPTEDRTARAIIRDEALRLFAERNPDAVTVRNIAAAAGVSPALVLRHYRSKDGLRAAVDQHVVRVFETLLSTVTMSGDLGLPDLAQMPSLAEQVARQLPAGSPIPTYLARMLVSGDSGAAALFGMLHALSERTVTELVNAGLATDGGDLTARAAFLLANDLAVLMLRERLGEVLGVDPLGVSGLRRWGHQVFAIYRDGLTGTPTTHR